METKNKNDGTYTRNDYYRQILSEREREKEISSFINNGKKNSLNTGYTRCGIEFVFVFSYQTYK